jgi:hypothetical protein
MSFALLLFGLPTEVLSPFPPPLRGPRRAKLAHEVRVGGTARRLGGCGTPTPDSSPQRGGEYGGAT